MCLDKSLNIEYDIYNKATKTVKQQKGEQMVTIKCREGTIDRYSLFVQFSYNAYYIEAIKSMPMRKWHPIEKMWEVPVDQLQNLLGLFEKQDIEISGTYLDMTPVTEIDYEFKTEPYEHQREGFLYGLNHHKWFLGDEQGLGKTKQVIDIACALKEKEHYKHCLIICGVNSLKWNWQREVSIHSNEESHIIGQRIKKRTGEIVIGSSKDKIYDLKNLDDISAYFLITNVESLRNADISAELVSLISKRKIELVAVDEIHKCKDPSSQQGKALLKIQPEYRIAMTGTPLLNSPFDLFIILKWLGYESHSFYQFKQYYGVFGGYGGYEVIGYRHTDELQDKLDTIMLRRLKDDVLDLPDKVYIDELVDMLPKQAVVYKEVNAEIKSNIDMIEIAPNPLAEMIRLRQATGYTGILSSGIGCSAKLDRMEELVEESVLNNRQVVIFSNWTTITDEVYNRLSQNYSLSVITGDTKDEDRQQQVQKFQDGKSKVIIGTTGAMGTGITLTAGTVVIFLDHPWTRALYDQAVDRCHRIGQNSKLTIYNIMCKDTIDEKVWSIVNKKGELSDSIVDGRIIANKRELVEYLLS